MTKMATVPIFDIFFILKKSSPLEPIYRWPWNLVCSIMYASTTKIVQFMTLGWPWSNLRQGQIWSHRLLHGQKWKNVLFGNYCIYTPQSWFQHLNEWVNEVKWVSKVKVIIWPRQKVTILFYPITLEGRLGTTDEFATNPFHLVLFSAVLVELVKSNSVHSLILSSHLFFCLPLFLFPFSVPCRTVFAKPEDLET